MTTEYEPTAPLAPNTFVAIWPRGFVKSTFVELANVYLAARGTVNDQAHRDLEADPILWLFTLFPDHMGGDHPAKLAPYHREFWTWVASQSTPRRYAIYVSDTQEQAETHVENIGAMLTSFPFAKWYPRMAKRKVGKYGSSQGWRRTRLRTASGWTVDAAGLDKGIRGARVERQRPDCISFDDLDRDTDSPTVIQRKKNNLTRSIIPTQAPGCIFLGAQNLVVRGGLFTQLADGTADFLTRRIVSGPHPALRSFDPERHLTGRADGGWDITGGIPTWRDLAFVQALLDDYGRESFLIECQHLLSAFSGLVYPQFSPEVHEYRYKDLPEFVAYYGGLDFGGEGEGSHNSAVVVLGLTRNNRLVLLSEWYDAGANVAERQEEEMQAREAEFQHVKWCMDGDERTYFQTLRMRHDVTMASRVGASAKGRRAKFGRRLAKDGTGRPGFYYLRKCARFRQEAEGWKRKNVPAGSPQVEEPIEVDDDVIVSVLYAVERCERDQDIGDSTGQRVTVSAAS